MNLGELINEYVAYRKSLGEKFKTAETYLKAFCKLIGPELLIEAINKKVINNFLSCHPTNVTPGWFNKYRALKGFNKYILTHGYTIAGLPLPNVLPKEPLAAVPYIYSRDELKGIFSAALSYPILKSHNSPHTVRAILVLTYSLGLRISETLALKLEDVDLVNSIIKIEQSKFYKSRLLPFNEEVKQFINEYLNWRKHQLQSQSPESPLFIGKNNLPFKGRTINDIFEKIRKQASRNDNAYYQPRIHDLRHTFAVHRLTSWYQENKDVQKLLPLLSTYLGHEGIAHTTIYLTMTNNLLKEANIRFEDYIKGDIL
jgi:site-specific recombinase XerD